jgi:DNA-binding IclR family transcriptional regulator
MHAYDEMKRLSIISEETIAMDVMVGIRYHSLLEIPSSHDLKVTQEYKKAGPLFNDLYCGASVKVMLSQLSDERLRIAMDIIRITRETKNTVTDKRILMEQLKDIRRKGYAITYSERVEGGMCIAAPVTNYILPIVLCVLGPENRLRPKEKDIIERLITSSSRISASLGNGIKRK